MSQNEVNKSEMTDEEIRQLVAESDTGGRRPQGLSAKIVMYVALAWSMFQLWIASPLPFSLGVFVLNDTQSRAIHLAFALFLGYMLFPPLKSSPRTRIPVQDWILALLASFCAAYLYLFYAQLAARPGWDAIPAVKNQMLFEIKSPDILQPGPAALTDGAEQLHRIVMDWMARHG